MQVRVRSEKKFCPRPKVFRSKSEKDKNISASLKLCSHQKVLLGSSNANLATLPQFFSAKVKNVLFQGPNKNRKDIGF